MAGTLSVDLSRLPELLTMQHSRTKEVDLGGTLKGEAGEQPQFQFVSKPGNDKSRPVQCRYWYRWGNTGMGGPELWGTAS